MRKCFPSRRGWTNSCAPRPRTAATATSRPQATAWPSPLRQNSYPQFSLQVELEAGRSARSPRSDADALRESGRDRRIFPETCDCGECLAGHLSEIHASRQVADIPVRMRTINEYRAQECRCGRYGKRTKAKFSEQIAWRSSSNLELPGTSATWFTASLKRWSDSPRP